MLKKLLFTGLGILPLLLHAQLNINAQVPPAGKVQKEQLWNLMLINNRESPIDVNIKFSLTDQASGQLLISAQGIRLSLVKGANPISANDVQPVAYTYNSQNFSAMYFPAGAYTACYQIFLNGSVQPLAEDCIDISADPLSPTLLSTPFDQEEIQTPYPLFTWMPQAQSDILSNLKYDLKVSEVLPNQEPSAAIAINTPVYSKTNMTQLSENYSASLKALQPDKIYAWQVVAKDAAGNTSTTPVRTFKVSKTSVAIIPDEQDYILLEDGTTGIYNVKNDTLHVQYYSFSNQYTTSISFTDTSGAVVKTISQSISPGNNYLDFELHSLQPGKLYNLSFADIDKKNHSLTFSIN